MSNPYDPYNPQGQGDGSSGQNPYGQNPYGQSFPSGGGYGSDPYGGSPQGYGEQPKGTDAVSITGFVLSLTCCLSIVGAILGFIGLGRTKGGKRKGRWAAISASIIGVLGTLAFAGIIIGVVFFAKSIVTVDEAEVGQCVSIDDDDSSAIVLREADCDSDHDGEIVYKGEYSEVESSPFMPSSPDDLSDAGISYGVCTSLMPPEDVSAIEDVLGDNVEYTYAMEDPANPEPDDPFICYVKDSRGDSIDQQLIK